MPNEQVDLEVVVHAELGGFISDLKKAQQTA